MNVLLHGHDPSEFTVAAQQLNDSQIRLYKRQDGKISHHDVEFFPFFFLSDKTLLSGFDRKHWLKDLAGNNFYNVLAVFTRWADAWEGIRVVMERYRKTASGRVESYSDAPVLHFRPDPVTQYLMQSGLTLFKGLEFHDLQRMQISFVSQASRNNRSDPRKTEDRILAIGLSDSTGWSEVLDGRKFDESALLRRLAEIIKDRDPDVLEGHNLFGHDLPFLMQRYALNEIPFSVGRDDSEPKLLQARGGGQEPDQDSRLFEIVGRHAVDTFMLAEVYDFSRRNLESLDLQSLATHFSQDDKSRVSVPPQDLPSAWRDDPPRVLALLRQNVSDIRYLSANLSPSSFYLTQMVPLSYGAVVRTGSAVKIESLLIREYLRQKHSLPRPERGSQTTGGYADLYMTGIFDNVVLADVESLYPSIILEKSITPATDQLGIFPLLLKDLVSMRLDAKRQMKESKEKDGRSRYDALQSSFKILINSFYGYLGYARGLFNDYRKADEITKTGQELLRRIVQQIELHNGTVLEVDTDGVFFIPPDNVSTDEEVDSLVDRISRSLPQGINLVSSGRFRKMMSYKKKNYALLEADGMLTIKGSSLVSRSMERFLRRFVRLAISNLLDGNMNGLHALHGSVHNDLITHHWEAADFCRTETIHDSFSIYERDVGEGKRNPAAAYEVVRRAGRIVKPGDRVSYYVTGISGTVRISENCRLAEEWDPNFPDENTQYYLARLNEATSKFDPFFTPEDFRSIFTVEDLFGFDAGKIRTIQRKVASETDAPSPLDEQERAEFRIWLGENETE
ncbi:MAG: DNA polymerase domain-containing protein [Bacteroidota bacterium]